MGGAHTRILKVANDFPHDPSTMREMLAKPKGSTSAALLVQAWAVTSSKFILKVCEKSEPAEGCRALFRRLEKRFKMANTKMNKIRGRRAGPPFIALFAEACHDATTTVHYLASRGWQSGRTAWSGPQELAQKQDTASHTSYLVGVDAAMPNASLLALFLHLGLKVDSKTCQAAVFARRDVAFTVPRTEGNGTTSYVNISAGEPFLSIPHSSASEQKELLAQLPVRLGGLVSGLIFAVDSDGNNHTDRHFRPALEIAGDPTRARPPTSPATLGPLPSAVPWGKAHKKAMSRVIDAEAKEVVEKKTKDPNEARGTY